VKRPAAAGAARRLPGLHRRFREELGRDRRRAARPLSRLGALQAEHVDVLELEALGGAQRDHLH
jgi:hypothetical protein